MRHRKTLEERFWPKVDQSGECWTWRAAINRNGYGLFTVYVDGRKRQVVAHRVAYEMLVGPIPVGLVLDHLCKNRACVNPAHLEPVTELENQRRGAWASRTHCRRGHPYDEQNTRVSEGENYRRRRCRTCERDRMRRRYHRLNPLARTYAKA